MQNPNKDGINWDLAVLGCFIDQAPVSRFQIEQVVELHWQTKGYLFLHQLGPYTVFECTVEEDADQLAELSSVNIYGRLMDMVLHRCQWWIVPTNIQFHIAHLWVRIEGLPVGLLNDDMTHVLLDSVGHVSEVMPEPPRYELDTFLRAKVWVDLSLPLIPGCYIPINGQGMVWVTFRYEKILRYCKRCGKVGHTTNQCRLPNYLATRGILRRFHKFQQTGFRILQGPDVTALYTNRLRGLLPTPFHWNTKVSLDDFAASPEPQAQAFGFQPNPNDEDTNSNEDLPQYILENLTGSSARSTTTDLGDEQQWTPSPIRFSLPCSPLPKPARPPEQDEAGPCNWINGGGANSLLEKQSSNDVSNEFSARSVYYSLRNGSRNVGIHIGSPTPTDQQRKRKHQGFAANAEQSKKKSKTCTLTCSSSTPFSMLPFQKLKRKWEDIFLSHLGGDKIDDPGPTQLPLPNLDTNFDDIQWVFIECECEASIKRAKCSENPIMVVRVPVSSSLPTHDTEGGMDSSHHSDQLSDITDTGMVAPLTESPATP